MTIYTRGNGTNLELGKMSPAEGVGCDRLEMASEIVIDLYRLLAKKRFSTEQATNPGAVREMANQKT